MTLLQSTKPNWSEHVIDSLNEHLLNNHWELNTIPLAFYSSNHWAINLDVQAT